MDPHRLAEERSLAYHRKVAEMLRDRPDLLDAARARARQWAESVARHARYAHEWLRILDGDIEQIAKTPRAAFKHQLARPDVVVQRLDETALDPERRKLIASLIRADSV